MSLQYRVMASEKDAARIVDSLQRFNKIIQGNASPISDTSEDDLRIKVDSRVCQWGKSRIATKWPYKSDWKFPIKTDCTSDIPELVKLLDQHSVLLIESPTGSGKSIIASGVAFKYAERASVSEKAGQFRPSDGFKGLHLVRSGEQASQNANYVRDAMKGACGIIVSHYSSALSQHGREMNDLSIKDANYLYTTHSFGHQALNENNKVNVVVIDEIHDFSPDIDILLRLLRSKLNNGTVGRVVLLTATISTEMKNKYRDYFTEAPSNLSFKHWCPSDRSTPFPIVDMPAGRDRDSQEALLRMDTNANPNSYADEVLYRTESDANGSPNMDVLRKRAFGIIKERIRPYTRKRKHDQPHPENPGVIVFLPGSADTGQVTSAINSWLSTVPDNTYVDVYLVNGQERGDLHLLKQLNCMSIRVVLTTSLLSTGVTPLGIATTIDTGTVKIPAFPNRQGIEELETVWQDGNQMLQRRGRVGRTADGIFFQCYSPRRAKEISRTDNTLVRVQRMFTTAHLAELLNDLDNLMVAPAIHVKQELLLEAGIKGFLRDHISPYSSSLIVDPIGSALSRCFSNLPLQYGLFLTMCASSDVLLHGLAFVASHKINHAGTVKPSREAGTPGRDSSALIINRWPKFSRCDAASDMMVYTEIIVNGILNGPARGRGGPGFLVNMPPWFKECMSNEGIMEVWRHIMTLSCGLRHVGLIHQTSDIFTYDRSGLTSKHRGGFKIVQLDKVHNRLFNIAIVTAFGDRVLVQAEEKDQFKFNRTMFTLSKPHESRDGLSIHLVQGERSKKSPPGIVAVYDSIFNHSPKEGIFTALHHECTPTALMLHANVYGSDYDIMDEAAGTLTIHTNTFDLLFVFDDKKLLKTIAEFRRNQRLIPGAVLLGNSRFKKEVGNFMRNLKRDIYYGLLVTRINDPTRVVHSIDHAGYFESDHSNSQVVQAQPGMTFPGEIVTKPGSKIIFNAPFDKHTCHVEVTNSSARRIGWIVKTTNVERLGVDPAAGVLDPQEKTSIAVFCDNFAYGQEDTNNDRLTIKWTNTPDGTPKQFRPEWFEEDGIFRTKNLSIEYNL